MKKADKQKMLYGVGALVLVLMVVFVLGKLQGRTEKEQREIDVQVDIKDENGQTVTYDPNPLLERLHKGLTTRYYFDFSERCDPIKELYSLDSVRFMAAVRAYKVKYGIDIQVHMKACNVDCNVNTGLQALSYFDLIYQRINNLKDIIK
ncbi:hypothetical protein [Aureispira sp. CCB-E]|uniref:hypothetical protein n=1 Tax=Aureispira sp. CCB-E TaxID=3051121 RepID=UPI0028684C54|nr:hypothetical protein [Aureispira sp. CCB-E]WMX16559.1 hypothetical protein QP953_09285 [Aureispira sp. CCB-E]